ncbi:MAG: hypothetical protein ACOYT4_01495 [Nanoarchaeota archaeon]
MKIKRGTLNISKVIIVLSIIAAVCTMILWYIQNPIYNKNDQEKIIVEIQNPALKYAEKTNLNLEEIENITLLAQNETNDFDIALIKFILFGIGINNLHNPPFSSDNPKIEFVLDDNNYAVEIKKEGMKIDIGDVENKDIIIKTTRAEAIKMSFNESYISDSFRQGKSSIELMAGKPTLLAKGYLEIYDKLS